MGVSRLAVSKLAVGLLTANCLLLTANFVLAQDQPPLTPAPAVEVPAEELWLKLTSSSGRKKLSLVIADFKSPPGTDAQTSARIRDIRSVLVADLRFSLHFTFEEPDSGKAFNFSTDEKKLDYKGWGTTGAQILVCGELVTKRSGPQVQLRLYDLDVNRLIATKAYALSEQWRWLAHQMADEVIKLLTPDDGVNRTRIAFSRAINRETKDLCIADYDGAGPEQLTRSGGLKLFPDWAPSGAALAYCTYGTSTLNIYTYALGSGKSVLVSARTGLNTTPAFSPDGRRIAASLGFEGNSEIYVMEPNGKGLNRLTNSKGIDISPCWSPNGRQIAFVSDRTGTPQIYVMNADGTDVRRLTFEGSYNTSPAWSPRGDLIAFVQRQPGGTNQICVTDLAGDTYMRLTSGMNNEDPCWSPDGLHIAFASNRTGPFEIYTMDWTGANQHKVTNVGGAYSPAWSPRLSR
ncbi:Tol-Pal system beta propeller repeat protein TolB [candidate division WOR-3 bacterium]|uniref:Tol-Pal system beta propeller repeat protein TolB n=1 Tax=candidate division WOR-3 bacterium TaxID=2052148 RepID=A0A938BQ81_UNCW3|nr:Tol-Pal system beta propeller repeat protein TolB [candidate division WOR-3 bacterium]